MTRDVATLLAAQEDLEEALEDVELLLGIAKLIKWHREYMASGEIIYVRLDRSVGYGMGFAANYFRGETEADDDRAIAGDVHHAFLVEIDPTHIQEHDAAS